MEGDSLSMTWYIVAQLSPEACFAACDLRALGSYNMQDSLPRKRANLNGSWRTGGERNAANVTTEY